MKNCLLSLLGLAIFSFTGCAELFDPNYSNNNSGYYDPYYGNSGYNGGYNNRGYDRERDRIRDERRDLERERERAERERERLQAEREAYRPPPPPPVRVDRCPSGFSPSEQKCSSEERRRGCRDIRTPSGLGCVSR